MATDAASASSSAVYLSLSVLLSKQQLTKEGISLVVASCLGSALLSLQLPDLLTLSSLLTLLTVELWQACTTTSGGLVTSWLAGPLTEPTYIWVIHLGPGGSPLSSSAS